MKVREIKEKLDESGIAYKEQLSKAEYEAMNKGLIETKK